MHRLPRQVYRVVLCGTVCLTLAGPGGAASPDCPELSVASIQADLAAGRYTAEALLLATLACIERYDGHYNAFVTLNPRALEEARFIDRQRAAGVTVGPLAGVPVAIKEAMDVAGLPTTAGWAPLASAAGGVDLIPIRDAPVVARLRAAGAVIVGKTNIPAFSDDGVRANSSWAGPTLNAVDPALAPGGSSSGTATAVAAGFVVAGLGEETGGSIQNPAAAQGLVGIKPTFGLVPNVGVFPLAGSTRDTVGPLARTVRDATHLLDVIVGYTAEDPKTVAAIGQIPPEGYAAALEKTNLAGKVLGLYGPGWRAQPLEEEAATLYSAAIDLLRRAGAVLVADPFAGSGFAALAAPDPTYDPRGTESIAYDLEQYLARLGPTAAATSLASLRTLVGIDPFSPDTSLGWYRERLPALEASLADPGAVPDLEQFRRLREAHLEIFGRVFAAHGLDALVFPQAWGPPPPLAGGDDEFPATTVSEINIAGVPAVVVPAGRFETGAPFALIFVGPLWSETLLLGLAYRFEQLNGGRVVPVLQLRDP